MFKPALLCLCLFLCGCGPYVAPEDPYVPLHGPATNALESSKNRFVVTQVAKFYDNLAHYGERGIYLIKDTNTGREFVGISGLYISELGVRSDGTVQNDP